MIGFAAGFVFGGAIGAVVLALLKAGGISDTNDPYISVSLDNGALMPIRAHAQDAGLDLLTPVDFVVPAHGFAFVDTGVHMEIPHGTDGHVRSKSGLNRKFGITADGTVDEGYTGTVGVTLHNDGNEDHVFTRGQKIAQIVIEKIDRPTPALVCKISGGERGDAGYGSTGE